MRIKFNKEIEFFFKKIFFSQSYLLKKRLERSIKNNEEKSCLNTNTTIKHSKVYKNEEEEAFLTVSHHLLETFLSFYPKIQKNHMWCQINLTKTMWCHIVSTNF